MRRRYFACVRLVIRHQLVFLRVPAMEKRGWRRASVWLRWRVPRTCPGGMLRTDRMPMRRRPPWMLKLAAGPVRWPGSRGRLAVDCRRPWRRRTRPVIHTFLYTVYTSVRNKIVLVY
jgi:hypothetical protein